jgi:hypothetical protein
MAGRQGKIAAKGGLGGKPMNQWSLRARRMALPALAVLLLASCSGKGLKLGQPDMASAYNEFNAYLDRCTTMYGVDPRRPSALGPFELAPNEREWRTCAHEGIKTILIPASNSPDMYWQWIAQDQLMTDLIAQQQMTRQQRDQRLLAIQKQIAASEKEDTTTASQGNLELTRGTIGVLQGY